jgi:hypothetical protein
MPQVRCRAGAARQVLSLLNDGLDAMRSEPVFHWAILELFHAL